MITARSISGASDRMPSCSDVLIPSAYPSLMTTRARPMSNRPAIRVASAPSTTTTSSSLDAQTDSITHCSSGRPWYGSSCLGSPMRPEPPAASTTPADRIARSARLRCAETLRIGAELFSASAAAEVVDVAAMLDDVHRGGHINCHAADWIDGKPGHVGRGDALGGDALATKSRDLRQRLQRDLLLRPAATSTGRRPHASELGVRQAARAQVAKDRGRPPVAGHKRDVGFP